MPYPTAKISSSVLLCVTTVTCALQEESFHLPSSSPFLISQHRTSSPAPATALPAPVWRATPAIASSRTQIAFDDADVTSPKVFECSNFLKEIMVSHKYFEAQRILRIITHRYDFTMVNCPCLEKNSKVAPLSIGAKSDDKILRWATAARTAISHRLMCPRELHQPPTNVTPSTRQKRGEGTQNSGINWLL